MTATVLTSPSTSAVEARGERDVPGSQQREQLLQLGVWMFLGTVTMLFAAFTVLELGRRAAMRRRWRKARLSFIAGMGLGIGFLGGQLVGWQVLVGQGVYVPTVPHSSFFYLLTGVHAVHLVVGLVVLAVTLPSFSTRALALEGASPAARAGLAVTFWHFFGGVWLYLLALLSWF
jgi:cytochrome c oxidase subunit 3